jgi:hypothetical protein
MSLTPNAVTELSPTTYGAADMLIALQARIATLSGSMLLAAGGAGDGFAFEFLADPGPQYILRRLSTTTWALSIEPSGSVTVVGTTAVPPTGTSADWSGERTFTIGTLAAGSKVWLIEHDDAITMLCKTAAGTSWQTCFQIGRIFLSDFPNVDEPLGFDGLGLMFGAPNFTTTASGSFIGSTASALPNLAYGLMHYATNNWFPPNAQIVSNSDPYADDVAYAPFVRPGVISVAATVRTNGTPYVPAGRMKYVMRIGLARAPLTRVDVNNLTDLAFIVGGAVGSTTSVVTVFPWLRGVVP